MRKFQLSVLLITSMLTEVSFGVTKLGFRPHFFDTHFQDPIENHYDSSSNELQTSEFEPHLERKDLRRKILTWAEKRTRIEISPTSRDYSISPAEIDIVQCVPLDISIMGLDPYEGNGGCQTEYVFEKKRTVFISGNSSPGNNGWVELITFSVPDGCDCRRKNE